MFARKKISENVDPLNRGIGSKKVVEGPAKGGQAKLKRTGIQTRRAAFGDITNATIDKIIDDGKKKIPVALKPVTKVHNAVNKTTRSSTKAKETKKDSEIQLSKPSAVTNIPSHESLVQSEQALKNLAAGVPVDRVEEDFSFIADTSCDSEKLEQPEKSLLSVDQENYTDVFNVGIYAQDIFDYYKRREKMFRIPAYLNGKENSITAAMRSILVDWMVEIQENFELNHETLYLAVKLTDIYLSRVKVDKDVLQLVGAAAVFIASKFDERCPPLIEDFTYICDNAFDRDQFIHMEMEVLRKVDFDLGIPISYRFLRRYAKVARQSMETLTLARYILELSLMDYSFVTEKDSMIAAASLFIAQKMRKEGSWEGDVVKGSGYKLDDFKHLVVMLNQMLLSPALPQLSTIRCKYSHAVFHEVAKISPLSTEELLQSS
ncbi:G2/mitotic-specific cyclin-B3-like [Physella acuta]|uniref:G2/mitotic-specific cyclin-B3-like n=1 Tax=Physella acuta TaxID=109671 RepID=UPI0027DDAE00|nr:G2/mitotic-specific cyclin-B3-like [Physella acuta]